MAEPKNNAFFRRLSDTLNEAFEQNDDRRLAELLSDDWVIVESSTGLSGKESFLAAIRSGALVHREMKKPLLHVTGRDQVAVLVTRGKNKGSYKGIVFDVECWVVNTWYEGEGGWRCLATQEIVVNCE